MEEHIYRLLHQILQDIDRFETEQLTDEEVTMIMEKFKKEINIGNANKKRKMKRSMLIRRIAAVVAVCCGTVAVAADHMVKSINMHFRNGMMGIFRKTIKSDRQIVCFMLQ